MSRLVVFATALSRLHADLLMVRLRQAGVAKSSLSAIYAAGSRPNSGICWLSGHARLRLSSGEPVEVSGRLRIALGHRDHDSAHGSLGNRLGEFGLTREQRADLEESLREGHLVLAVEIHGEALLTAVFQVLDGLAAEKILPVSTHARFSNSGSRSWRRRLPARLAPALPSFAAFA